MENILYIEEKSRKTNIFFPFSHDVFYCYWTVLCFILNSLGTDTIITNENGLVLKYAIEILTLCQTNRTFDDPFEKMPFENIMGKGENSGNPHFLPFS